MEKNMVCILLSLVFILLSGCSTMHYTAQERPMINFKNCPDAHDDFKYKEKRYFLFWGLRPDVHEIDVTAIATENGAPEGLCEVRIEEKASFVDIVINLATLGILSSRTFSIEGKIINSGDET